MQNTQFTESEIRGIRGSFERVWPHGDEFDRQHIFLKRFYQRFFHTCPELEQMFAEVDMRSQRRMLFTALKAVVHNLENPGVLEDYLTGLGDKHRGYGELNKYYEPFTRCLLQALAEVEGDFWTRETAAVWQKAMVLVCRMMMRGQAAKAE